MTGLVLSRRAVRDLQRIGRGTQLARIREGLDGLAAGAINFDIKPLAGNASWHRLRIGDHRVLYRPIEPGEVAGSDARLLVARIVHRRDLERAVSTLS
jgi:mRNA-degrading endonuclease RelE of RelBE toxin-antitoxin system